MPLAVEAQNPKNWTVREFCQFFFASHISEIMVNLFLCLTSFTFITSSGSSHIVSNDRISFFSSSGLIIILWGGPKMAEE